MTLRYAARLSPITPETVWSIEEAVLVEQRGRTHRFLPLSRLDQITLAPAMPGRAHPSATLRFGWRRLTIPGASFSSGGVRVTPESFATFVRALAPIARQASPSARFLLAGRKDYRAQLIWVIGLAGVGAVGLALTAASSVTRGLGLSLAAWLAFAAFMTAAVLPWIEQADDRFDPEAIPDALLPISR